MCQDVQRLGVTRDMWLLTVSNPDGDKIPTNRPLGKSVHKLRKGQPFIAATSGPGLRAENLPDAALLQDLPYLEHDGRGPALCPNHGPAPLLTGQTHQVSHVVHIRGQRPLAEDVLARRDDRAHDLMVPVDADVAHYKVDSRVRRELRRVPVGPCGRWEPKVPQGFFALSTDELHSAVISYLALPRGESRYGRWAALAHETAADLDRPIRPMHTGEVIGGGWLEERGWDGVIQPRRRFEISVIPSRRF